MLCLLSYLRSETEKYHLWAKDQRTGEKGIKACFHPDREEL